MEKVVLKLFEEYCDSEDENWNVNPYYSEDWDLKECEVGIAKIRQEEIEKRKLIYNYIKVERPKLVEQYDKVADTWIEDEIKLFNEDTKYLTMIIEGRGSLWT